MSRLVRTAVLGLFVLAALAGLPACGEEARTPYIAGFDPPSLDSFRGGMKQSVVVRLSEKVLEKTYVDIEISGVDAQHVSTNPDKAIIFGAGTDTQNVEIIAKMVTAPVTVSLKFTIRGTAESRTYSFEIKL